MIMAAFNLEVFLATLRNPRWDDAGMTKVALDGTMPDGSVTLFVAHPDDPEAHGRAVLAAALRFEYGPIGAYVPPPAPTQAQLAAATCSACSAVGDAVIASIEPTIAQSTSFATLSAMVIAAGYAPPITGPNVERFNAIAAQFGVTQAQLVSIVAALEGAALAVDITLRSLVTSANAATDVAGLVAALATFMAAIGTVVSEVNAAVPQPITLPGTPSIPGVNA